MPHSYGVRKGFKYGFGELPLFPHAGIVFFFFFLAKVSSLFEKIKVSKTGRILWSIVGGATPLTGTWATFPGEKKNQKKSKKNRKHGFALERESWVLNTLSLNLENSHALITPLVIKRAIYSPFRPWKGTVTIWQVHLARLSVRILGFNCVHASWFFLFFFFGPARHRMKYLARKIMRIIQHIYV